jgi:hypothetical protein
MPIKIHNEVEQGTPEWLALRCGLLTASEMKNIITPKKLEPSDTMTHVYDILAQRITGYTQPSYQSYDMERGNFEEPLARAMYAEKYGCEVQEVGFVTNDKWGFTIGCSPDGLVVGQRRGIEIKSRAQDSQVATIVTGEIEPTFMLQMQTCMLVLEYEEWEFISYSGGLEMYPVRVPADKAMQAKIIAAATAFEGKVAVAMAKYKENSKGLYLAPRTVFAETGDMIV